MSDSAPRHAYLIAAHDQPELLKLLLRLLDDEANDLYLHIDKKAASILEDDLRAAVKRARVTFVPRQNAVWGSEVFVDVIVSLLREAAKTEHLFYHLLSGADLPLKPQREIQAFFAAHAGEEFVAFDDETADPSMLFSRLGRYNLPPACNALGGGARKRLLRVWSGAQKLLGVRRKAYRAQTFQKGAVWFSITHACALYALEHAPEYRRYYRFSTCADELWLQTILLHSPFMEKRHYAGFGDELAATLRYVDWAGGNSPRTLTMDDYAPMLSSGALFARKFSYDRFPDVVNRVAEDARETSN